MAKDLKLEVSRLWVKAQERLWNTQKILDALDEVGIEWARIKTPDGAQLDINTESVTEEKIAKWEAMFVVTEPDTTPAAPPADELNKLEAAPEIPPTKPGDKGDLELLKALVGTAKTVALDFEWVLATVLQYGAEVKADFSETEEIKKNVQDGKKTGVKLGEVYWCSISSDVVDSVHKAIDELKAAALAANGGKKPKGGKNKTDESKVRQLLRDRKEQEQGGSGVGVTASIAFELAKANVAQKIKNGEIKIEVQDDAHRDAVEKSMGITLPVSAEEASSKDEPPVTPGASAQEDVHANSDLVSEQSGADSKSNKKGAKGTKKGSEKQALPAEAESNSIEKNEALILKNIESEKEHTLGSIVFRLYEKKRDIKALKALIAGHNQDINALQADLNGLRHCYGSSIIQRLEENLPLNSKGEYHQKYLITRYGRLKATQTGGITISDKAALNAWVESVPKEEREFYGITLEPTYDLETLKELMASGIEIPGLEKSAVVPLGNWDLELA